MWSIARSRGYMKPIAPILEEKGQFCQRRSDSRQAAVAADFEMQLVKLKVKHSFCARAFVYLTQRALPSSAATKHPPRLRQDRQLASHSICTFACTPFSFAMEFFRAGETIVRSSQPLLSFLAPSTYRTLPQTTRTAAPIARHCRGQRTQSVPARSFSSSTRRYQQQAAENEKDDERYPDTSNFPSTAPPSRSGISDDISSLLDSTLDMNKGTPAAPTGRTSHFHSPRAQENNPPSRGLANEMGRQDGSTSSTFGSMGDFLAEFGKPSPRRPGNHPSPMDVDGIILQSLDPQNRTGNLPPPPPAPYEEPKPMKLGPEVGRTIHVDLAKNMDVGRAFRTLEMTCARNSVRRDMMKQRYHERPGMKRKRLKSERWRRNFKQNFQGVVQLVQKMKRQGW